MLSTSSALPSSAPSSVPAVELSVVRLNLLRAGYLLLVVGLGLTIWPTILDLRQPMSLAGGVVTCMLGALSALSLLGLRYPLQLLPLLLFEMAWKVIWLARVGLPLWSRGALDAATAQTLHECLLIVAFPIFIPWRHVVRTYLRRPGAPWRTVAPRAAGAPAMR